MKKPNCKKKLIKPIKILKKPTSSVWFQFYKSKTEKTKPNLNRKKPSQTWKKLSQTENQTGKNRAKTEPNQFELVFFLKNWTESKPVGLNRFQFLKKISLVIFFYKNRAKPKMITPKKNFDPMDSWSIDRYSHTVKKKN